ncbi:thiaminase II/PqqC family protein [Streptomyces murinus]|uniref:hypothetical protein n=1 Tax=Streptomyces murinus TaxID=33900 RepID=UPI0036EFB874
MTLRQRLCSRAEPLLAQVRAHPFWTGLCDGTLPPESLWHFAEQDFRFTVPAYARALARAAAVARRPEQGALLAGAAGATFESLSGCPVNSMCWPTGSALRNRPAASARRRSPTPRSSRRSRPPPWPRRSAVYCR